MQLQIFAEAQSQIISGYSYQLAAQRVALQSKINLLTDEYEKKKEIARYLAGNKRGAWGRTTIADEKRSIQLDRLKSQINRLNDLMIELNK
jgi:hypothetical protein